jgi:glutathione S-transferase
LYLDQDSDFGSLKAKEILSQTGPTAKVPTLHAYVDGEKIIVFESLAIMEFLYEG